MLGGIYKGLYIFLGGTFKEYTITLIQGSCGDHGIGFQAYGHTSVAVRYPDHRPLKPGPKPLNPKPLTLKIPVPPLALVLVTPYTPKSGG